MILPEVQGLIDLNADQVQVPDGMDARAVLGALCMVESTGGRNTGPIVELSYAGPGPQPERHRGGYYWRKADHVRRAWDRWGDLAACSYGPWQILYVTALECGLPEGTDPAVLRAPAGTIDQVVRLLNRRVFRRDGAREFEQVLDAWNTGTARDDRPPAPAYVTAGRAFYQELASGK